MKHIIAQNGESEYIIDAWRYGDETIRFAASELQKYLLAATGAALPYFSDRCEKRGPEIRIGENVRGKTNDLDGMKDEGFLIAEDGEDLVITGKTSRGVLYGVYRFLELYCGFRCFAKDVVTYDRLDTLTVTDPYVREEPAFTYRESYFRFAFDGGFASKNRLNSNLADLSYAEGYRMKWYNFHHSFRDLVPAEVYFDSHPEYFSEIDGVRIADGQPCLSNPEVVEIAKKQLRTWIKENPSCRIFSVAQNDNRRFCRCARCAAVDAEEESPAGSVLRFVNQLADDIAQDHPDVLLHTFAYQYTVPKAKLTDPRPNVIVRLCDIECRFDRPLEELAAEDPNGLEARFVNAMRDWAPKCRNLYIWDYAVNFRNYLQPFFHFHVLAENIRYFRRCGVDGVLEQGNFAYGGGAAFDELKSYLTARLLWNPDEDVDALIREWTVGVFGEKAGKVIGEYLALVEKACSSKPLTIYQEPDNPWITDELVAKMTELFDRALAAAENETFRARVEREQLSARYLTLVRLPMDAPERDERIDRFITDVKRFGMTEIMERRSLPVSRDAMKRSLYAKDRTGAFSVYYTMQ